jgi:hypothetical protein
MTFVQSVILFILVLMDLVLPYLMIMLLAFGQNVSFSIVSRSRNRNNMTYHLVAAIFSNGMWFLTFHQLITKDMTYDLFIPYTIGTVGGSLLGVKISMMIEKLLDARSDSHLEGKACQAK